jgi:transcriptional regulator with XRE-family HTH domain
MTNKEKFLSLVTEDGARTRKEIEYRALHRARLKESYAIGVKVLLRLRALGWSQIDLAREMQVSPQQVNKIVRGKQNLTLDTLVRLQMVLDIPLLATYNDGSTKKAVPSFKSNQTVEFLPKTIPVRGEYRHQSGKVYKVNLTFGQTQTPFTDKQAS